RCIAPFYFSNGRFSFQLSVLKLGSRRVRMARLFGDGCIVRDDANAAECFAQAFEVLWSQRSRYDLVHFDRLFVGTALWDFFQTNFCHGRTFHLFLASPQLEKLHFIELYPTHDQYMGSLSPKTRQNLRRTTRKLCEECNAHLEIVESAE